MRTIRYSSLLRTSIIMTLIFLSVSPGHADETNQQPCAPWGSIGGIELYSPFANMTVAKLLSISVGAMPADLVRDGLPWFGAARDDFLGKPRDHKGLDFYGSDLPIVAMANGRVETRSQEEKAGYFVVIDHGNGVKTTYMHLDGPYSGPNVVKQGDMLGNTGISGNAFSPQLHLGITVDGKAIDPLTPVLNAADKETNDTIDYYRSLIPTKTEARAHLVSSYVSSDEAVRDRETKAAFEVLSTIASDQNVLEWINSQKELR